MERSGYLDLYLTEAHEYMQALHRGLLTLGQGSAKAALDEAFRAAHTLKGMSALMGYRAVAAQAHELEDRLEGVKSGRLPIDSALIDELLSGVDSLERLIEESVDIEAAGAGGRSDVVTGETETRGDTSSPVAPRRAAVTVDRNRAIPAGARLTVRITLSSDVPNRTAAALLIIQRLSTLVDVVGSDPSEFDDEFPSTFAVYVGAAEDRRVIEAALGKRSDVLRIAFEETRTGQAAAAGPVQGAEHAAVPTDGFVGGADGAQIRVDARQLDALAAGVGELAALRARLTELAAAEDWQDFADALERVSRLTRELQESVLAIRLVPLSGVFERFPAAVQERADSLGKDVAFRVEGGDVELDRSILDEIAEPVLHLLFNSLEHGLESPDVRRAAGKPEKGLLLLRASRNGSTVLIEVADDGRGVLADRVVELARLSGLAVAADRPGSSLTDDELFRLLSRSGFSTTARVTETNGRGLGLDVVATRIRSLGGGIEMRTTPGEGTRFTIQLPLTLALLRALRLRVGGEEYAIPLTHVTGVVDLDDTNVSRLNGGEGIRIRHQVVPLVRLADAVGAAGAGSETTALLVQVAGQPRALAVHASAGREEIVVRRFDVPVGTLPIFSGVALLPGTGRPALILDPTKVL